jgi:ABC-2 type transport system permease protein
MQFKLDFRNKNVLTAYYVLPISFYLIIGAIFKEITPHYEEVIMGNMTVLSISLAAYLGTPAPLVDFFSSDIKKTYNIGNISIAVILLTTFLSAMFHIAIVSTLIYMTSPFIFDAVIPSSFYGYILTMIVASVVSVTYGILIGILCNNSSTMTMVSQLAFLPTMLMAGIILPTHLLPDILSDVSIVLPATHIIELLSFETLTTYDFLPLLYLFGFGVLAIYLRYRSAIMD